MGNHFAYTINGPQPDIAGFPIHVSKSPSVRREPKFSGNNLRNLYQNPAPLSSKNKEALSPTTPVLPPTPPNVEEDVHDHEHERISVAEAANARSILATPVNQISPPTPDNTPPRNRTTLRPFLGTQPSMASTRAESFKTAHEDIPSDKESVSSSAASHFDMNRSVPFLLSHLTNGVHRPSPLANLPITSGDLASNDSSPVVPSSATIPSVYIMNKISQDFVVKHDHPHPKIPTDTFLTRKHHGSKNTSPKAEIVQEVGSQVKSRKENLHRGRSLRERLEDSKQIHHSPSMDKFASIIGWSNSVQDSVDDHRRWSGASNTSTVEAFLIEPPQMPKKRNTLRHVSKNDSLRSASSPLPNSNRTSMQSSSDSPHRLVHKKVKLSNRNRLSFGSEVSQPVSTGSNTLPKLEVIKVAVIPERSSSLQQPITNSRRPSHSTIGAPTSFRMPRTLDNSQRKRATSETMDRGRDRHYPPQVPPRGSSLSAPTSRNTSRANSITSEHLHSERKRAEKDLRTTLDKMESERLAASLRSASLDTAPLSQKADSPRTPVHLRLNPEISRPGFRSHDFTISANTQPGYLTPGSKEWADLRPTSALHTPFSQPSYMSASPEISEAKMISLHVHNNHSVQLIEPNPLQESDAVEEARKLNQTNYLDLEVIDSPLRNPRRPPAPPQLNFIPPTPLEGQTALEFDKDQKPDSSTQKRPGGHERTDSFAKNLLRTVSLKNTRNKKANQELDSSQNPFWRPRPFWEGIEGSSPEKKRDTMTAERNLVNNSLGLPQQRIVVAGPLELVRKFSERRRNRKTIAKQSSYSSLRKLRTGRQLYRLPGFGMQLHLMSLRDIQERIAEARQNKEEKKREKRREALRKSIGANVIATGDSRFPANMNENNDAN